MGNISECMHVEGLMGCGKKDWGRVTCAGVVGGRVCGCDGGVGGFEFLVVWEDGEGVGEEV